MKNLVTVLIILTIVSSTGCATNGLQMKNVNLVSASTSSKSVKIKTNEKEEIQMLVLPHESLGLSPTQDICRRNISVFMITFPLRLFGEYFPGRLRWNTWTILPNGTEKFGQIIFVGMHPSGCYFGIEIIDGQISSGGQTAILSSAVDYIYSPLGKELKVDRVKFLADSQYRKKVIQKVNKGKDGNIFNLSLLSRVSGFQEVIKSWNQIKYPEGYLLSPYGVKEVATIRRINPQYSYFQKLIGTGKFRISPIPNPIVFAISNSIGIAMDMIKAAGMPSRGWDFDSQISRRQMSLVIDYLLKLSQKEVQKRNITNAKLLEALDASRRKP
jgi:hypothetical protein